MTPSVQLPLQASIMITAIYGARYFQSLVFLSNRRTNLQMYASTRTGIPDTASELDVGSATGHTSSSHSSTISRNQGEGFLTTRPSTVQGKTKKFPKFKFSLTAPPPKPKPKLLEQARPAVVSCPLFYVFGSHQRHTCRSF